MKGSKIWFVKNNIYFELVLTSIMLSPVLKNKNLSQQLDNWCKKKLFHVDEVSSRYDRKHFKTLLIFLVSSWSLRGYKGS